MVCFSLGVVMMSSDDVLTKPAARRIEVFTGSGRRRRWDAETKSRIVAESYASSVGEIADRYGLARTQLFAWRRDARADSAPLTFAQVRVEDVGSPRSDDGVRDIEVVIGTASMRIPPGADMAMVTGVLAALRAKR